MDDDRRRCERDVEIGLKVDLGYKDPFSSQYEPFSAVSALQSSFGGFISGGSSFESDFQMKF